MNDISIPGVTKKEEKKIKNSYSRLSMANLRVLLSLERHLLRPTYFVERKTLACWNNVVSSNLKKKYS